MVNDRENQDGSNDVSDIPIKVSESCVQSAAPTTSPSDGCDNSAELQHNEDNTKSTTPLTINTNFLRLIIVRVPSAQLLQVQFAN